MPEKKYYWLKLQKDFFNRKEVRLIKSMPNGKDYMLFYLEMICESIDQEGKLRFSDKIPYSEDMLAVLTDTNVDIVRAAIKIFIELGLVELLDDGTLFMTEVQGMIGSESGTDGAIRARRFRERHKMLALQERYDSVTERNESKSIEKEEKENIKEKELKTEFVSVWKEYPRKEGKVNAERDYIKARKEGVEMETILEGIRRYKEVLKANKTEMQYTMQGSTWFHQRRWTDEYTKTSSPKTGEERDYDYETIYEEVYK